MIPQDNYNKMLEVFQNRLLKNILLRTDRIYKSLIHKKPLNNSIGNYIAYFALGRLRQSIQACVMLLRKRHGFEAVAVMRQVFEQYSWISYIYDKKDKKAINRPPQKCISSFIGSFPEAGRFYGTLSEVGHMYPRFARSYLSEEHFDKEVRISVIRTPITETAQYSIVLLLFVGLFGLLGEMISSPHSRFKYLDTTGSRKEISGTFIRAIAKYQLRLIKLTKYVSDPPELKLIYSKESGS